MKPTKRIQVHLKHFTLAMGLGIGLGVGSASAQTILEVGGDGVIGDETLATNSVPATGVNFTAEGGEGFSSSTLVSPTVTVTADGPVTLSVDHRYFIEAAWDGAAVFVSVNGAPATYLPGTAFSAEGYVGDTLANNGSAWPGGENVFYGKSTDYDAAGLIESVAELGSFTAGDTISVEFRMLWDGAYFEPTTNWEIGAVRIDDAAAALLDVTFQTDGPGDFTVSNVGPPAGPFVYAQPVSVFELDADTLTADRYAPSAPGSVIDLNHAKLVVELLTGTLSLGDSFTLFDLSGGSTLTGTYGSISLPPGVWNISQLAVDGTITLELLPPLSTPGVDFEVNASADSDGNDIWEDVIGSAGIEFFLDTANGVSRVATGSSTQLVYAYDFPGNLSGDTAPNSDEAGYGGGKLVRTGDASGECYSFQDGPTPAAWDTKDVSIEIWFKPDDLASAPANGQILYEDGGGTGFGLFLTGSQLVSSQDNNEPGSQISYDLGTDPSGLLIAPATTEFIQCVVTRVASGATEMFINGTSVGTSNDADGDWTGGDGFALGARGEANAGGRGGGDAGTLSFDGQIALFRVYSEQILTPTEVAANFAGLSGPDTYMAVTLTTPADNLAYPSGTSIVASATITDPGTPPYTVEFWVDGSLAGTATTSDPYTLDLGVLADGPHEAYVKVTDSATPTPLIARSATHAFSLAQPTDTTTTLASSANPSTYGGATVTATVVANDASMLAGGTVQFFDGGTPLGAPVAVDTATGEASYDISTLGVGPHSITADYGGHGVHSASSASALPQVVEKAPLTVMATSVFRATEAANLDPLPYTITGYQNGEDLGTSGVTGEPDLTTAATLASPAGDYPITCALGTLTATNYSFTLVDGTLTVSEVPDTFSVNFYAYGALPVEAQPQVLMEEGEPAGLADWFTSGWANIVVPWNPGAPQAPVTLTSNRGSTATFTLITCRNGGPYVWNIPRTTLLDDGNGSMMDAHVNSTEDSSEWFDMEVTDIPFAVYDVIFYMGVNQAQFTPGTGNIVVNGGATRKFTLKPGAFDGTFVDMVDETTPGNYMVFEGLTGDTLTTRTWGDGFCHAGPTGFQIRAAATDYGTWAEGYPDSELSDPDADYDGDGLSNNTERLFGLDPTSPASQNPIAVPLDAAAGTFSFTRRDDALTGLFSGIETSTDLVMWTEDGGATLTPGAPDANNIQTVEVTLSPGLLNAPKLFVRVVQDEGILFAANFEADDGGFTAVTTAGSAWEFGAPTSMGLGGDVVEGNGGSAQCWGTDIGNPGEYAVPTATKLRSPVIDLTGVTGAQLTFAEALDLELGDTAVVNIIAETGDTVIAAAIYTATDGNINSTVWEAVPAIDLAAGVGMRVRLEWAFTGGTAEYLGWYIDDVTVSKTVPAVP